MATACSLERSISRSISLRRTTEQDLKGAQLPFNFHLIQCPWSADAIAQVITEYEAALPVGAWPNWVMGNHDQSRIATRIGERAGCGSRPCYC